VKTQQIIPSASHSLTHLFLIPSRCFADDDDDDDDDDVGGERYQKQHFYHWNEIN
jgi:hypothetical protein